MKGSPASVCATPEHVDKMTTEHGWFKYQLQLIESAIWGRWPYWIATVMNRRLGPLPDWSIPQLPFSDLGGNSKLVHPNESFRNMAGTASQAKKKTLDVFGRALRTGGHISDLFRWWLYAFGSETVRERPELSDEAKVAMYSDLNLGWMLCHPGDWAAAICLELAGTNSHTGWFPTPLNITKMMTQILFDGHEGDTRALSVHDPCVGTGVMLLCASNYSLCLSGQDVNQTMCLGCEFNAWLFVPWLVYGRGSVPELRPKIVEDASSPREVEPDIEWDSTAMKHGPGKIYIQGSLFDFSIGSSD